MTDKTEPTGEQRLAAVDFCDRLTVSIGALLVNEDHLAHLLATREHDLTRQCVVAKALLQRVQVWSRTGISGDTLWLDVGAFLGET